MRRCCVADQHHLHASYQVCAEADFFKTERIDPHSKDERLLFKVGLHADDCSMRRAFGWSIQAVHARSSVVACVRIHDIAPKLHRAPSPAGHPGVLLATGHAGARAARQVLQPHYVHTVLSRPEKTIRIICIAFWWGATMLTCTQ